MQWPAQLSGGQDGPQFHEMQSSSMSFDGLDIHGPYSHPHAIPAATSHAFSGHAMPRQHPSIMLQGSMGMPTRPFFEADQNNPGVATMNTSMIASYPMQRPQTGEIRLEIPSTSAPMVGSVQSTPVQFSPSTVHSPSVQTMYTHQPSPYLQPTQNPVDQQSLMQYPYPHDPTATTPQSLPHDLSPLQAIPTPLAEQQNHGRASPSEGDFYSPPHESPFEEPPRYFANPALQHIYFIPSPLDFCGDKDPNDPSMQMPSERMNTM